MKALFGIIVGSVLVGFGLGAVLAYYEVQPPQAPVQKDSLVSEKAYQAEEGESPVFPEIQLSETIFEFDRMERGTSKRHDFVVKNVGKAPLAIRFESNTCKCTGVAVGGELVEPGDGATIAAGAEINITLEWAAKTSTGPFRHGARFSSSDPRKTSFELLVNGDVVESTSMRPSELFYGQIQAGESKQAHLYLMSLLDQEVQITDYELTPPELSERLELEIKPAEKGELPLAEALSGLKISGVYKTKDSLGPFQGWLTLKTNLANAETLLVPILGSVKGPVSLYGPRWSESKGLLNIGPLLSIEGIEMRMHLTVTGEYAKTTKFEVASVDPPEMQVSLGEPQQLNETNSRIPLKIEIPPYTKPMVRMGEPTSSDATIILKSNHPQAKEFKMRVHFAIRR